jgi:hypothetical protein
MKALRLAAIAISLSICACTGPKPKQSNIVLTVDQLVESVGKYASEIVDVRGEVILDYHGTTLCDLKGTSGFLIFLPEYIEPKPDFELVKDKMYEDFERLSIEIGSVQKQLGKAKLLATLRGRYDIIQDKIEVIVQNPTFGYSRRHRFVLQRVLNLEVQRTAE